MVNTPAISTVSATAAGTSVSARLILEIDMCRQEPPCCAAVTDVEAMTTIQTQPPIELRLLGGLTWKVGAPYALPLSVRPSVTARSGRLCYGPSKGRHILF